jgi:hypothetical protein
MIDNTSCPDIQNINYVLCELITYILRQAQTCFLCVNMRACACIMVIMTSQKTSTNILLDHMYVLCDFQLLSSFFISGYLWNMLYEG